MATQNPLARVEEEIEAVKQEINLTKQEIEELKEGRSKDVYVSDIEYTRARDSLSQLRVIFAELLKKENLLRTYWEKNLLRSEGGSGSGGAAAITEQINGALATVFRELRLAISAGFQHQYEHIQLLRPNVSISASKCSSSQWIKISTTTAITDCSVPCCLGNIAAIPSPPTYIWLNPKKEEDRCNVESGKVYLEEYVLPAGVRAVPVERLNWINARIDCGQEGFVSVKSSRTDYLLLISEGSALLGEGGDVTEELVLQLLPFIVGFYEVKTPGSLTKLAACKRQAMLEYLAGNLKRNTSDKLVVIFGDLNKHYCVHASPIDPGQVHIASSSSALMPVIPEGKKVAGSLSAPQTDTMLGFVQALLDKAVLMARERLSGDTNAASEPGPRRRADNSDSFGGSAASGSAEQGSSSGMSGDGECGSSSTAPAGGHGASIAGGDVASNSSHQHGACVRDGEQGSSSGCSSREESCHDEAAEEGARINAFTQQMVAILREPEMYKGLGLNEPPSSFHPLFMEDYLASFARLL